MSKHILTPILFLATLGITVWQLIVGKYWILVAVLATISLGSLLATIWPLLKWGCHMIKTLWEAWRHPNNLLYIWDLHISSLPTPSEHSEGFEWTCGFKVVSLFPWDKRVCFELEILEPPELARTKGYLCDEKINKLSSTNVGYHSYPMSNQAHEFWVETIMQAHSFLPIRILIKGRDKKGKDKLGELLLNQSVHRVVQG